MPKFIREGRFGPPKSFKTGSVVRSYPRPILVLEFDNEGLDIIRESIDGKVNWIKPADLPELLKPGATLDPRGIYAIDLSFTAEMAMETAYSPPKDKLPFEQAVQVVNHLRLANPCPFKTIVLDTVTSLSDSIYNHQAVLNSAALADARKWAGNIGMKVKQMIEYFNSFKANTVFIFHEEVNKDEDLKTISRQPMVYSKLRDFLGGLFSQFFYQDIVGGNPKLRVKSFDLVRGIGCRWPEFQKELVDPDFKSIYGGEKDVHQ